MTPSRLRRMLRTCGLAALVSLTGCDDGSSGGSSVTVTDLELAGFLFGGSQDLWLLGVFEHDQGQTDLNGDGDTQDLVAFVCDLADGSLVNLGQHLADGPGDPVVAAAGALLAFPVEEASQGVTDLNGDGDFDDIVLFVHDQSRGRTTNTHLALADDLKLAVGLGSVGFAVSEAGQGAQDLDGDGDASDAVMHVFDARTTVSTNSQRSVTSGIAFHDHQFAFTTDEDSAQADLNGDGDASDDTIFDLFDLVIGGVIEVPLAIRGLPVVVNVEDWFPLVDEAAQALDSNGDGDLLDGVYHRIEPHLATQVPIGLSSEDPSGSTTDAHQLALVVQEIDGLDHNGDGDQLDSVLVLYDASDDQALDSGMAIGLNPTIVFLPEHVVFLADEAAQGEDLDGDGNQASDVVQRMDRASGAVENLGLVAILLQDCAGRACFAQNETFEDRNGDGDTDDTVESYIDPASGEIVSTHLATGGFVPASNLDSLLLWALESGEGADMNGDGDTDDSVYVLHDVATRTNTSLGLAYNGGAPIEAAMSDSKRGLVLVSEFQQGQDLNGDGDTDDTVVFRFSHP
jgi:hypothetical protein